MVDEPDWVYDNLATEVISRLSGRYHFIKQTTKQQLPKRYDLVHYATYAFAEMRPAPKEKCVCGLVGVHGREIRNVIKYVNACKAAAYRADYMRDRFCNLVDTPLTYIPDAIDTNMFVPAKSRPERPYTVGWNGNPNKSDKRFQDLRAAVESIPGVVFKPLCRHQGHTVPYSHIPPVYHGWDCYVCYSSEEGFCLPLIEAASSGLPVVSTDVGCAKKIKDGIFIISTLKDLVDSVKYLKDNKETGIKMGMRGRQEVINNFDWSVVSSLYDKFFQENLPIETRHAPSEVKPPVRWVMQENKNWAFKNLASHVIKAQPFIDHSCGVLRPEDKGIKILMHPDMMQAIPPDKKTILRIDSNRWYE